MKKARSLVLPASRPPRWKWLAGLGMILVVAAASFALAGLAFMDSTGIQVLVRTARSLDGRGRLILVSPGSLVKRILDLIPVAKLENVSIVDEDE